MAGLMKVQNAPTSLDEKNVAHNFVRRLHIGQNIEPLKAHIKDEIANCRYAPSFPVDF